MVTRDQHIRQAHAVSLIAAIAVLVGACLILVGWWTHVEGLRDLLPGAVRPTGPIRALGFCATALGVLAYFAPVSRWIGVALGALAVISGSISAIGHIPRSPLANADSTIVSGITPSELADLQRVSLSGSIALIGLGIAVMLLNLRICDNIRPAIAAGVGLIGLTTLLGYALGAQDSLTDVEAETTLISATSAVALVLLGSAVITASIEVGWTRVQVSDRAGGRMSRILIPSLVLVVFLVSVIVQAALLPAGGDPRLGFQLSVLLITVIMLAIAVYVALRIDRVDEEREATLTRLEQQIERSAHLRAMTDELTFATPDPELVIKLASRILLDGLPNADACIILRTTADSEGQLELAAASHRNPQGQALLRQLLSKDVPVSETGTGGVFGTRRGFVASPISYAEIKGILSQRFWPYVDQFGVGAVAAARVDIEGTPSGVVVINAPTGETISEQDLEYLEEVARILGLSLTSAGFYSALQRTNQTLEARVLERTHKLEKASSELEAVLESAADAIYTISATGEILRVNEAAGRMFGYAPQTMIGMSVLDLSPEDGREAARQRLKRAAESGVAAFIGNALAEREMIRSTGERFTVQTTAGDVQGETPADIQFTLITRDITIQVDAEKRLRVAEERFRSAFDGAPIGMALTAMDGSWLRVNRSLSEIVGYPEDALIKMSWQRITHPDDLGTDEENLRQLAAGEIKSYAREKRYLHADGHIVWVSLSVSIVRSPDGAPLYFIAQMEDVTERRELIDALNRTNEDLRRFAYVASHDLQAPLRTVGGFTQVLIDSIDKKMLNDEQLMMAEYITTGVVRMQMLIRDLLSYGRIDSGVTIREDVPLSEVVEQVAETLAVDITSKGAILEADCTQWVVGDPGQIRQLIQNLVSNGIDHYAGDGQPIVRVVDELESNGMVRISVADNGPGIAPEDQEKVFELFKQLKKSSGTGIGLAIVKRIVERHGGRIWIESDGHNGTTMCLTLPASSAQPG